MLNVKNIKLNMTARTKEEVIEELTDLLRKVRISRSFLPKLTR
ncbi:PTS sugar transporter subunit IIA [Klebsiella pneumoniae]|nr:PTS sugar transporter subunit IIA [Klebsiella pneumoniae]MBK0643013.1 PTS sugar transporter subunit IIA [Klebsiella pneumoniae]